MVLALFIELVSLRVLQWDWSTQISAHDAHWLEIMIIYILTGPVSWFTLFKLKSPRHRPLF